MWSVGCIVAELWSGTPIFPGESEQDQLGWQMDFLGLPPDHMVKRGSKSNVFFEADLKTPKKTCFMSIKRKNVGQRGLNSRTLG